MAHVITLTLCISIDETIWDVCIPAEVCWSKAAITLPDETCITLPCSRRSALSSDKVVILVGGKRGDLKSLRKMPLTLYDAMLIRGLSCPVLSSGRTCRVVLLFTVSLSMWTLWNSHLVKSHLWCFLKYATSLLNMCLNSSRYGCNLTSHTEKKDTQREGNHFLSPRATTSWMLYWKLQVGEMTFILASVETDHHLFEVLGG